MSRTALLLPLIRMLPARSPMTLVIISIYSYSLSCPRRMSETVVDPTHSLTLTRSCMTLAVSLRPMHQPLSADKHTKCKGANPSLTAWASIQQDRASGLPVGCTCACWSRVEGATLRGRSWKTPGSTAPAMFAIAPAAHDACANVTNAKPRDSPFMRSRTTCQEARALAAA